MPEAAAKRPDGPPVDGALAKALGEKYFSVRRIGQGSFGTATLVRDLEGRERVVKAVRICSLSRKRQEEAVNEVNVLAFLKHPFIVRYHESFIRNGILGIVMDYAAGGDLQHRIRKQRRECQRFSEEQILRWFSQALLGLKYLHGLQVIHRDLKSQNLFLTAKDELRIGDFGISKTVENASVVDKKTLGTPYYSSPEIFAKSRFSPASDVWALGCVLYEMACLRVPFDADSLSSLMHKVTHGPIPVLCQVYSENLRQLHADLMRRDYQDRPSCVEIIRCPSIQEVIRRMLLGKPQCPCPTDSPSPTALPLPVAQCLGRPPQTAGAQAGPTRREDRGTVRAGLEERVAAGEPAGSSGSLRRAATVLLSTGASSPSASGVSAGSPRRLSRASSSGTLVVTGWSDSGSSSGLSCVSLQASWGSPRGRISCMADVPWR